MQSKGSTTSSISNSSSKARYRILFLTEWYPNKFDPQLGVFVQKHAKAIHQYCSISVVYVCADENLQTIYNLELSSKNGFEEITVYYRRNTGVFNSIINTYRYLKANKTGVKRAEQILGSIDLVHVNVLKRPIIVALILNKTKRLPFIISEHWTGYAKGIFEEFSFIKKWFLRIMVHQAKAITTVSIGLKESMLNSGLKGNYRIIPNIIESITPPPPINNSKTKILTVADLLDEQKNISGIIKAIASLTKNKPLIEYHIIGDGPDRDRLMQLAKSFGLMNTFVFFHGRKDNEFVYQFMKEIDFVVINSRYETFSVVATEALANGKPVVATICGGPEEFINSDNGILIEQGNQTELELAIEKMILNFKTYEATKINYYITEKFNYNTIGKQFYELYTKCLNNVV